MSFRSLIATLLWLTYALLLGHDVLPHHHHDAGAIAHQGIPNAGRPDADHHDEGEDEPDWWFAHQHSPGATVFKTDTQTIQVMPVVAVLIGQFQLAHPLRVYWPGQTVGWPPAQAKAPPGQHRYRPLRAPPIFSLVA